MAIMASSPLHRLQFPKCHYLSLKSEFDPRLGFPSYSTLTIPAAINNSSSLVMDLEGQAIEKDYFACPICYEPLIRKGPSGLNLSAIYRSGFKCKRCRKSFSSKDKYLDLTVTSGLLDYTENQPYLTELFRSPFVSFLYERGWRQNFNLGGFPGPEEEFKMAQDYFQSAKGGCIVDVSCGTGLISRKFAKSGSYSGVVALDFSENMLRQCYDFINKDDILLKANLALVRADVCRLPFSSGSVDAVHAGAALHCWPSPSNSVAEISRILRSGGIFVGTTFLRYSSTTPLIVRLFRESVSRTHKFLTEQEIEGLCMSCGLINYTSKVHQSFIIFSAQKP
ncbi:hypothetical protein HN51_002348 [Arachis hypogaea]|nr:uncharacterized methyltransferase At2g41040, chloroplastic [Arachis hypogaea]QHO50547.1 putative methyltransferase [Arachis hypogaea]